MSLKEEKVVNKQSTEFFIELYDSMLDGHDIISYITMRLCIDKYAFIKHDKDVFEDGTPKKTHYHLYIKTSSRVRLSTIALRLEIDDRFVEFVKNTRSCLQYLIHKNNKDKYQYNASDVVTNINNITSILLDNLSDLDLFVLDLNNAINEMEYTNDYSFRSVVNILIQKGYTTYVVKYATFIRYMISRRA